MMLPMNNISAVLGRVMFPALAQMQGDIPRFKKAYLKSVQMIAFIAFPSMVLASVIAEPFINLVLGEKWAEVVPIFRILCWAGLLQSIVFPVNWIFTSLGKTKVQFQLSVILGILYIISILIGLKFGIVGVALAYLFISIPSAFINFVISGKYIYLSVREVFKAVSLILCMSLLMGIILALADHFYFRTQNDILRLAALTIIGITLFVLFCKVIKDATYTEFLQVVTNKILKRKER
jgi:PST family polysaccharide transporter